jgi:hypothetical protein
MLNTMHVAAWPYQAAQERARAFAEQRDSPNLKRTPAPIVRGTPARPASAVCASLACGSLRLACCALSGSHTVESTLSCTGPIGRTVYASHCFALLPVALQVVTCTAALHVVTLPRCMLSHCRVACCHTATLHVVTLPRCMLSRELSRGCSAPQLSDGSTE